MEANSTVAAVTDPGLAVGPLSGLLAHGREALEAVLDEPRLAAGPAVRPFVLSLLAERHAPLLVVTPRTSDAEALTDGLSAFLGHDRVAAFPAWETLPHERLSPQPSTVGRRLAVLDRLVRPDAYDHPLLAVVAPVRAALQPMDPQLADRAPLLLDRHHRDGFDALVEQLVELGYTRTPQVETRGEFAVRGGLVDVFPSAGDHAVRIEFWGDDVDSIRTFGVADQRSVDALESVTIDPARELVLNDELRTRARAAAARYPSIADQLHQLADGILFEGVESLVTLVHPRPALLPDFLPETSGIAVVDPLLVRDRADRVVAEAEVLLDVSWEAAAGHRPEDAGFASLDEVTDRAGRVLELTPFEGEPVPGEPVPSFRGDVRAASDRVRGLLAEGLRVVATTSGHGPAQRLGEVLTGEGVPALTVDSVGIQGRGARAEVTASSLREGFLAPELGLAILAEFDLFGPRRRRRAGRRLGSKTTAGETVLPLEPGDFVVHRTHGVGRYGGLVTREIPGPTGERAKRDFVVLEYAKGDTLYVPSDQVDALSRYQGGEQPSVMRLGGAEWERAKNRVRGAVREIAAELIRLYAARMHSPGNAVSPDTAWQGELEDAFEHEETPDQLTVLDEIKRDLEAPLPMDRVLTGDVGFGKTEVAVRAAAKVTFDAKQVAVLVPTTLLAQQHSETFRERLAGFPVEIAVLSRFATPKERRDIIDGLAAGTVDIVIGTHALLSPKVRFKDLGLVIVDEEQRFGVTHKERLKQLRTSVDVLTMTATPIPRTLEMAVSGIRDLSVIETPPEDRQPIVTVVAPYDEAQVALAIRRELLREGQVFYVHNQVETIDRAAAHLHELVPDARIRIAHGQMSENELEHVMVAFWDRAFDVLVCTTIIESGLDVPNANTLVVERADLLGLAQLHQLRGRVGRSSERGYAYFLHPADAAITEGAYERLQTISQHFRLGSGLQIALRDLELRGAGNVVGAEQSGHVAAVGFDMYTQLLKEEVADLTGEPIEAELDVTLELPVDAHLPADYVADEKQRLALYKRIAAIRDASDVKAVRGELDDRFGAPPEPAARLLTLAALKAALRRWGVTDVTLQSRPRTTLKARPVRLSESLQVRLQRRHPHADYHPTTETLTVPVPAGTDDIVAWVAATLRDVLSHPLATPHPRRR
ncbi:MAG: transcription-repair coupling factor [Actinobacteria bacterium]|nr:transcription-repair coupling factor [Actinomycetota bacterium]